MKKEFHVSRNEEFQKIIGTGKFKSNSTFVVYYLPRRIENHDRVGISASKKLGNAVMRNKIKRQVRMMVDEIDNFDSGYDKIIIVRMKYLKHTYLENKKDLSALYFSVYNKQGQTLKGDKN